MLRVFQFLSLAAMVAAHGRMTNPPARQLGCQTKGTCGSDNGLVAGGPASVHAQGGYIHGMCGNAPGEAQTWNAPGPVTTTYTEGQTATFDVVLTAHHIGYFEFELCPSPLISEECFKSHRLLRTNCTGPDVECRKWWKPLMQSETGTWLSKDYPSSAPVLPGTHLNAVLYRVNFDLPMGVTCSNCVVRWHYLTTNSCSSPSSAPEEFWNCADVRVEPRVGGQPPSQEQELQQAAALVNTQPQDQSAVRDFSVDFWSCPQANLPAANVGRADEYSCGTTAQPMCFACQAQACTVTTPVVGSSGSNGAAPTPLPTAPPSAASTPTPPTPLPTKAPTYSSASSAACGSCSNGCLWEEHNACYPWHHDTCALYFDQGYSWCGDAGGAQPTPLLTPAPTAQTPPATDSTACGTCIDGCLWVQHNACYSTWSREVCERYTGEGYAWCGA